MALSIRRRAHIFRISDEKEKEYFIAKIKEMKLDSTAIVQYSKGTFESIETYNKFEAMLNG